MERNLCVGVGVFGGGLGVGIVESQLERYGLVSFQMRRLYFGCTAMYFGLRYEDMDTRVDEDRGGV